MRGSVEGTIACNTPSLYLGTTYTNVQLTFEGGRVVKATGDPQGQAYTIADNGNRSQIHWDLGLNPEHLAHQATPARRLRGLGSNPGRIDSPK